MPFQPSRNPTNSRPCTCTPVSTTPRMTALRPGASPPPVRMPIAIRPLCTVSCGPDGSVGELGCEVRVVVDGGLGCASRLFHVTLNGVVVDFAEQPVGELAGVVAVLRVPRRGPALVGVGVKSGHAFTSGCLRCERFYPASRTIGWRWGRSRTIRSERLEHRHRRVVAADTAHAPTPARPRAAQQYPLVRGGDAPARGGRGKVVVVVDERPIEPAVEDVARGKIERRLEIEGRLRLDARVAVSILEEKGLDRLGEH